MATPPQPQPYQAPQPFPPQQGIPPQQGFPQQGFPQQGFQQQPGFPPPPQQHGHTYCRICGGFPAVEATVRGHQGILVMMRFLTLKGPFCRNCGTAVRRDMTGKTLLQGWWSPVSLVLFTPLALLWNLFIKFKIDKLPAPVPGQPGQQLDPGQSLLKRPAAIGLLIPLAWVAFMVFQAARGS